MFRCLFWNYLHSEVRLSCDGVDQEFYFVTESSDEQVERVPGFGGLRSPEYCAGLLLVWYSHVFQWRIGEPTVVFLWWNYLGFVKVLRISAREIGGKADWFEGILR